MQGLGFKVGKYNTSTFYHEASNLKVMVHGDDFVTVGERDDAKWMKENSGKEIRDQNVDHRIPAHR